MVARKTTVRAHAAAQRLKRVGDRRKLRIAEVQARRRLAVRHVEVERRMEIAKTRVDTIHARRTANRRRGD